MMVRAGVPPCHALYFPLHFAWPDRCPVPAYCCMFLALSFVGCVPSEACAQVASTEFLEHFDFGVWL